MGCERFLTVVLPALRKNLALPVGTRTDSVVDSTGYGDGPNVIHGQRVSPACRVISMRRSSVGFVLCTGRDLTSLSLTGRSSCQECRNLTGRGKAYYPQFDPRQ